MQDKAMAKIEDVLNTSDDYNQDDLRVLLEAIHLQQSIHQANMNTYAIRYYLKDFDGHLSEQMIKTT